MVLSPEQIGELLDPYYASPTTLLLDQLSVYLELLMKWNARTNLTAIRTPREIVSRHFGESLFTAIHLPAAKSLLDFGSGAGFPGLPIQLALPLMEVTLGESQRKKGTFLREVVRALGITTKVWVDRVENMPTECRFDVVTLRAVDDPVEAMAGARLRLNSGGVIAHLSGAKGDVGKTFSIPGSNGRFLRLVT